MRARMMTTRVRGASSLGRAWRSRSLKCCCTLRGQRVASPDGSLLGDCHLRQLRLVKGVAMARSTRSRAPAYAMSALTPPVVSALLKPWSPTLDEIYACLVRNETAVMRAAWSAAVSGCVAAHGGLRGGRTEVQDVRARRRSTARSGQCRSSRVGRRSGVRARQKPACLHVGSWRPR